MTFSRFQQMKPKSMSYNHVIIQLFRQHEDASLVLSGKYSQAAKLQTLILQANLGDAGVKGADIAAESIH